MQQSPLILTLLMEEKYQHYLTQLRNQYFPKHCNYLEAHITLFHNLPSNKKIIETILQHSCKRQPMELSVPAVKNIGTGVAFEVKSAELMQLHKVLQQKFNPFLITQDRKKLWPHITIQNKVTAFKATKTLALIQENFEPFTIKGVGIGSWLYQGGPWEKVEDYWFKE